MNIGVYPGSFDPLTNGHFDLIQRASLLVDELVVAVLNNSEKKPMFTLSQRVEMIRDATRTLPTIRVEGFEGLLVQFARQQNAQVLFRGLRNGSDFEQELSMSTINQRLAPEIQTVCLLSKPQWNFLSSSIVKEMLMYGQDVAGLVPEQIHKKILAVLQQH